MDKTFKLRPGLYRPIRGLARMDIEQHLVNAMDTAGGGIGAVTRIGKLYKTEGTKKEIYGTLTEFVMTQIGEDFTRASVNYAEVIGFTEMVSKCTVIVLQ